MQVVSLCIQIHQTSICMEQMTHIPHLGGCQVPVCRGAQLVMMGIILRLFTQQKVKVTIFGQYNKKLIGIIKIILHTIFSSEVSVKLKYS